MTRSGLCSCLNMEIRMSEEEGKGRVIELFPRVPLRSVARLKKQWFDGLVRLLNGNSHIEAEKAAKELAELKGSAGRRPLLEALEGAPTVRARTAAANLLRRFDEEEVVAGLTVCALRGDCRLTAYEAALSLIRMSRSPSSQKRFSLLLLSRRSRHEMVRFSTLNCLLLRDSEMAVRAAVMALTDRSVKVRDLARRWLSTSDRDDIVPALRRARRIRKRDLLIQHYASEILLARRPDTEKDPD